jgi:hypothetical protein
MRSGMSGVGSHLGVGELSEVKQFPRVAVGDFEAVRFADGSLVEPVGRLGHILVWLIHGVQNAIRSDFLQHIDKCLGEGAAGSEVEVFPQILAKGKFGSGPKP